MGHDSERKQGAAGGGGGGSSLLSGMSDTTSFAARSQSAEMVQLKAKAGEEMEGSREEDLQAMAQDPAEMSREIFQFFFPGIEPPETSSSEAQDLASEMLWKAVQASRQMDLVPRPGIPPGVGWLVKQAVQAVWRRAQDKGIYVAVRNVVAAAYRTRYEMLRNGI